MTASRDTWLPRLREVFGGRAVAWTDSPMDYDGRERTLAVFNADAHDQRGLLTRFRTLRPEVEAVLGGPVVVIFHTRGETARLYPEHVASKEE